jgi:hypothetical protein
MQRSRELLVGLLEEASQLEHCLLNAYLYAACTLKTLPEEFATTDSGEPNRRRAIQFERTRAWKLAILNVAHEEMLHLHYVQCLLRALGERPSFTLPPRDPDSGHWLIGAWRTHIEGEENGDHGTEIPVDGYTPANARRFIIYESTDALQDANPFGPEVSELFRRLHALEVDLTVESMLLGVEDDGKRAAMKAQLEDIYATLTPTPAPPAALGAVAVEAEPLDVEDIHFQSIADLYLRAIQPLYEEAFDFDWVAHANRDLNNELLDPNHAGEGFLPIGPVYRDKNFEQATDTNQQAPLKHFRQVSDIIAEIVEEGEGAQGFVEGAEALLAKVEELGGARAYLQAELADQRSSDPTPEWLHSGQMTRGSHLYSFAVASIEFEQERELAQRSGTSFDPARTALTDPALDGLAATLAEQFNSAYLVLIMWLSRIYEVKDWAEDKPRRESIEMLASWPLMSLSVRPFLELASFVPIDSRDLFRLDAHGLPTAPVHARQLFDLFEAPERSPEIDDTMDYLALRTLTDVAHWAAEQAEQIEAADIDETARGVMVTRLRALAELDEFTRQFPFRVADGYSNRQPDLEFLQEHPDGLKYEESGAQENLFSDCLVLRLRFAGRGLVQLSTDPDTPTDEAGCTGTHMLHAADAPHHLDRALVWQPREGNVILREPREELPPIGIRVADVALLAPNGDVESGYVPLSVMQSTGAVQTTGVQQELKITGLEEILTLPVADVLGAGLGVDLLSKDGRVPYLNGYNHLVWQDGEPIDPFVFAIVDDAGRSILQREIFNDGLTLMQMSPLQRLDSARGPCGFDSDFSHIPPWARAQLSEFEQQQLDDPGFPRSWLHARGELLARHLDQQLAGGDHSQAGIDAIISFAERLRLVSVPRGTTIGWLGILCQYGHTVSGSFGAAGDDQTLLGPLSSRIGAQLAVGQAARTGPNGRWLLRYVKGVMDTDALSDLVFGEAFIPLQATPTDEPVHWQRTWRFAPGMAAALAGYACRFDQPFWAHFDVDGDTRTIQLPDGTLLTETLATSSPEKYTYTATGMPGISGYSGSFSVNKDAVLHWSARFKADSPASLVRMLSTNAAAASAMTAKLKDHFGPH